MKKLYFLALFILLTACAGAPDDIHPVYTQDNFANLNGWGMDSHEDARAPLLKSCGALQKQSGARAFGGDALNVSVRSYQLMCSRLVNVPDGGMKNFIEQNFTPYQISEDGDPNGLFTGYYEASLRGSRTRHGLYQTPVLRKSPGGNNAVRSQIIQERWRDRDAIAFVDDPVDAFFLQIQGSGQIQMDDGSILKVGFDGQNGHKYYAIGAALVQQGELTREQVSMQSIRAWLKTHPERQNEIMNLNPSYVFFKEKPEGPIGAQGVTLTAERSLAVDRRAVPYGALVWLDAEHPDGIGRLQHLLVAQDTGGAIKGAVRGDVFWGNGLIAEQRAGIMKSKGRDWILLPK